MPDRPVPYHNAAARGGDRLEHGGAVCHLEAGGVATQQMAAGHEAWPSATGATSATIPPHAQAGGQGFGAAQVAPDSSV